MPDHAAPTATSNHDASHWRNDGSIAETIERPLANEAAIGLLYDSQPYVVVMGTPADIEDLAVGFTLTERIAEFRDIEKVNVTRTDDGLLADILLSSRASRAVSLARRRSLESRSSCGLCGVESLRDAVRPIPRVTHGPSLSHSAIQRALAMLDSGQALGNQTRATHAAAWADARGEVCMIREDVGRHNALDKLVGAAARSGLDPHEAFIIVTSRCSYEMVEKTAAAGVSILVAISAPTALAIEKATAAGMTLVALARSDGHCVFTGAQRIVT